MHTNWPFYRIYNLSIEYLLFHPRQYEQATGTKITYAHIVMHVFLHRTVLLSCRPLPGPTKALNRACRFKSCGNSTQCKKSRNLQAACIQQRKHKPSIFAFRKRSLNANGDETERDDDGFVYPSLEECIIADGGNGPKVLVEVKHEVLEGQKYKTDLTIEFK